MRLLPVDAPTYQYCGAYMAAAFSQLLNLVRPQPRTIWSRLWSRYMPEVWRAWQEGRGRRAGADAGGSRGGGVDGARDRGGVVDEAGGGFLRAGRR